MWLPLRVLVLQMSIFHGIHFHQQIALQRLFVALQCFLLHCIFSVALRFCSHKCVLHDKSDNSPSIFLALQSFSVAMQTFGTRKHVCCTATFVSCSAISGFSYCNLHLLRYDILISCTSDSTFCCATGRFLYFLVGLGGGDQVGKYGRDWPREVLMGVDGWCG